MLRGVVKGSIWSTKRVTELPKGGLLEIELEADGGGSLVAFDPLGCCEGERVLIVQGSVASAWFGDSRPPIDALIIGSIDEERSG